MLILTLIFIIVVFNSPAQTHQCLKSYALWSTKSAVPISLSLWWSSQQLPCHPPSMRVPFFTQSTPSTATPDSRKVPPPLRPARQPRTGWPCAQWRVQDWCDDWGALWHPLCLALCPGSLSDASTLPDRGCVKPFRWSGSVSSFTPHQTLLLPLHHLQLPPPLRPPCPTPLTRV